ncbi:MULTISPECIES: helix-turn-helix transcriptional regulator [Brevibacterium]|uniref:DeoR family transcriptional regulator n=3 Tax=Brevibacterium casei TaxID=33889 RepID=K9AQJ9_9MICO|nr:WYL domain-containing protein [Brevibacterium casei]NJE68428.1 WYL domain-containing protein [Brevibacterium sp. LS14]EKU49723.1 DeoR family transcriptional regulator [Brevibacterium casei S18]KZE11085.1 DNA-binding transcriptional regulator [Brevibacterium casei]MCT1447606.1 WYL domain-containing protein [Brevibacterium casei]MCT1765411.1 WYL domain-containing protein [Brevibacterium casei]
MKAARLVSEIVLLSARSTPLSARELARRLEVTERTIYRDLRELSAMGVPVVAESGPGGGISLLDGWTSPLSGLTRAELESVLLGSLAATDLGLSRELATARAKILAAETGDADFSRTVVVDGPDWFTEKEDLRALEPLVTALRTRRGVRIVYTRSGESVVRCLIPLGLAVKAGRWYLVAQPPGGSPRTYRVARITDVDPVWTAVRGPADFDLGAFWEKAKRGFDRAIRTTPVRLRLAEAALPDLLRAVPGPLTAEAIASAQPVADGDECEVDILLESAEIAVSQLLTVPGVTVVSPPGIRDEVASRARDLVRRNGR